MTMRILHLDIETTPNTAHVWGLWGVNVSINQIMDSSYTLCWAAGWDDEKEIAFSSLHQVGKRAMIQAIWDLLDTADAVVHYNGKRFDIPTLNKEFLKLGMPPPSPFHQIDLLHIVKKRFRFPSNKLDYVAQQLGLGSKTHHKGHALWVGCMAGNEKDNKVMQKYNIQDVVLLKKLYRKLLPWIQNHPNHALYTADTRPLCPNCGSHHVLKCGTETTGVGMYQRYRCKACKTPIRGRTSTLPADKRKAVLTGSKL